MSELKTKDERSAYEDGLNDGEQLGVYKLYRIVTAMKKQHAPNSGAGRVLKELQDKLKKGLTEQQ